MPGRQASTMLGLLTKKLKNQSLNEIKPVDQKQISGPSLFGNFDSANAGSTTIIEAIIVKEKDEDEKHENSSDENSSVENICENKENIVCHIDTTTIQNIATNNNNENQLDRNVERKIEESKIDSDSSPQIQQCNHDLDFNKKQTGEKRKFSRTSLCQYKCLKVLPLPTYHGDSSSDEEIKELYSKHKCQASKEKIATCDSNGMRKIVCLNGLEVQRPSLNFDKMQQTGKKKSRPRVVKLKTLPSLKSRELNDLVSFKPINLLNSTAIVVPTPSSILVPVEEPYQNGYAY